MKRWFPNEESINKFIDRYLNELKKPYSTEKKNGSIIIKWKDSSGNEREGFCRKRSEHPEHLWIFNAVKKECKKFIQEHGLGDIERNDFKSQWKNNELIRALKVSEGFKHTDIKHAYWQVSRREGYISEKTYNKVVAIEDPAMKVIRNKALSCMTSPTCFETKLNGVIIEKREERDQDLRILYKDIRLKTFRIMKEVVDNIGAENAYMYKIDGIIYKPHVQKDIEDYLNAKGYLYETENGFFIGDNLYVIESNKDDSGKVRRF